MKKYLVGGAIRDKLLQLPIKERDWVVVGATQQDMLCSGYQKVGKDFPVFLHPDNQEEYALARKEKKFGYGHTKFIFFSSPEITLKEDLFRRDLTVNAIACNKKGKLIDPYSGQIDIERRLLRHVSDAFKEDPLRILRVARFAARFAHLNFRVAPETMKLMQDMAPELLSISHERVWMETEKALATYNPQIYFQVLRECIALKIVFPEINELFGISLSLSNCHKSINLGTHTLMSVAIAAQLSNSISIRFAVLCKNFGKNFFKKKTWKNNEENSYSGIKSINNLCTRLKIPNKLRDLAKISAKCNDLYFIAKNLDPEDLMKLFNDIDAWRQPNRINQIILINESIRQSFTNIENDQYGNIIREAYNITNSVRVQEILKEGFINKQISKELNIRRQTALEHWKKQKVKL